MKDQKVEILLGIGIMITLLLSNIVIAEEIPITVGDSWIDRIISNINYFFHEQEIFTIYGRELSCSINPDKIFNFVTDQKYYFNEETRCGSQDFFVNYFRGEYGFDQYLKEIYYYQDGSSAYVTDGDGQGSIYITPYLKCDAGDYWDNKCYVEIYCCDRGVCIYDSDCESDEECNKQTSAISDIFSFFGVCEQEEVTYHTTKVYECSNGQQTYIKEVSKGDINWCPDPDENNYILLEVGGTSGVCYESQDAPMHCTTPPKICWKIQDNQCASISIYTDSCENSGYYSSELICEQNVGLIKKCWNYFPLAEECRLLDEVSFKTCLELGKYDTEPACKSTHGLNGNGEEPGDKKGISADDIMKLTYDDLQNSLCIEDEDCTEGTCYPQSYLISEGYMTESKARSTLSSYCEVGSITTLIDIYAQQLGLSSGVCGWFFDDFDKYVNNYGYCITEIEEGGFLKFIRDIGKSIPITGDQTTDGFIVVIGGIFVLFLILSRLYYGEFKWEIV